MSTPFKRAVGSSEGFTPDTFSNSSRRDGFAELSPATQFTNYTPPSVARNYKDTADLLASALSGVRLDPEPASASRVPFDDPFVEHEGSISSVPLSTTATDYAPALPSVPTVANAHSNARAQNYSSTSPTTRPSVQQSPSMNANMNIHSGTTRYVKVTGPRDDEAGMTRIKDVKTMEASNSTKKLDEGVLIFRFDHLTDAALARNSTNNLLKVGQFGPEWHVEFVDAADFHGDHSRDREGQLKIAIYHNGKEACDEALLIHVALNFLKEHVDVLSYAVKSFDPEEKMAVLEANLSSVSAADVMHMKYGKHWNVMSTPYEDFEFFTEHNCSRYPVSSKPWHTARSSALTSIRGFGGTSLGAYNASITSPDRKDRDSKVDLKEIRNGNDCRTTVMIRNIPNKIDAQMFKTILDEHVFARYDFSYLRIDFTNNCNVGYAFVNFKQPADIETLYTAIVNKPWEVFSSDKIADVCYATNQGLGTCIEKFRNSSVMLEWPAHRPKLWYTTEDGDNLAGQEKPFPEPSNLQKLHRSRANAHSVGLFPPRGLHMAPGFPQAGSSFGGTRQHREAPDTMTHNGVQFVIPPGFTLVPSHAGAQMMAPTMSPNMPSNNSFGYPAMQNQGHHNRLPLPMPQYAHMYGVPQMTAYPNIVRGPATPAPGSFFPQTPVTQVGSYTPRAMLSRS